MTRLSQGIRFNVVKKIYLDRVEPTVGTSGGSHEVKLWAGFRAEKLFPAGAFTFTPLKSVPEFADPGTANLTLTAYRTRISRLDLEH